MRFHAWRLLVCSSLLLAASATAWPTTRPHYGGTLRIQLLNPISQLDGEEAERLLALVGDTLVAVDGTGEIQPKLATEWQHDAAFRRWRFRLRARVPLHDSTSLSAADAADSLSASLKLIYPGLAISAVGDSVVIEAQQGAPLLLDEIAQPRHAIVKRNGTQIVGTGPFRLITYEPGNRAVCTAFEEYWNGRAFVDSVEITAVQTSRTADVVELPATVPARQAPDRMRVWSSAPLSLMAIEVGDTPAPVSQALSDWIERTSIANVLTQRRGEPAYSVLPQWMSGYAFVFAPKPDKPKTKITGASAGITYSTGDTLARLIAERAVLTGREAGFNARLGTSTDSTLRVVRVRLAGHDSRLALQNAAREFGIDQKVDKTATPQALYEWERAVLRAGRFVPVVFVPDLFAIGQRVRNWEAAQPARLGWWQLENVWLAP